MSRVLVGLIREHGHDVLEDPVRLDAFLRDMCPGKKAEINCLVSAVRDGAVDDLRDVAPGLSGDALVERLAQRSHSELGLDLDAASWTSRALAGALGLSHDTPADSSSDGVTVVERDTAVDAAEAVAAEESPATDEALEPTSADVGGDRRPGEPWPRGIAPETPSVACHGHGATLT